MADLSDAKAAIGLEVSEVSDDFKQKLLDMDNLFLVEQRRQADALEIIVLILLRLVETDVKMVKKTGRY